MAGLPLMCTLSRTKSVGRLPRSVEMMTQRPVMGSLRSSGKLASWLLRVNILLRPIPLLGGVECAFVQADYGLLAGAGFDGQDVEAAWGGFDVAGAEEVGGPGAGGGGVFP